MFSEIWSRTKFFFAGKRRREVDEEIAFHLQRETEENMARGMTPEEARRRAAIDFGSKQRAREECREAAPRLDAGIHLARCEVRRARACTESHVHRRGRAHPGPRHRRQHHHLQPARPGADAGAAGQRSGQLAVLSFAGSSQGHRESHGGDSTGHVHSFSYPMYKDLRDRNTVFSGLIGAAPASVGVTWNNRAESVSAEMVSGNYFDVLGVQAAVGRLFVASDETAPGSNPVAVLNFDYWKSHLAEAPVVGKTLLVNGSPFTILGVAPPGFHSMEWGALPQIYVPLTMQKTVEPEWDFLNDHKSYFMNIVGRLKPGVTEAQATAAINPLFRDLRAEEFTQLSDQSAKARTAFIAKGHLNLEAGAKGFSPLRDDVEMPLTIIMGMVVLVILMAIVNVASLLLVRAATRAREFPSATRWGPPAARCCASCSPRACCWDSRVRPWAGHSAGKRCAC